MPQAVQLTISSLETKSQKLSPPPNLMLGLSHYVVLFYALELGLSQLFQNNFGNNRLRLELENYSSLMGQNVSTKITKGQKGAREKCK